MRTLLALSVVSLSLAAGCGGTVARSSSGDSSGNPASGNTGSGNAASGGAKAAGVADNAASIEVQTETLGEAPVTGTGTAGCSPSMRTIDVSLATGDLVAYACVVDADAGDAGSMQVVKQKTLDSAALDHLKSALAGYHETEPPAKNTCGYDGTAFLLKVTGSADTTTYWDDAYNCEYPDDVKWVTPRLNPLFAELDAE